MLVSWNWLKQYVALDVSVAALTDRLTMSGLNLEEFHAAGSDVCIDLEVTSNRPDCLGHLGVAREAAVLYRKPLTVPAAAPRNRLDENRLSDVRFHRMSGSVFTVLRACHSGRQSRRQPRLDGRSLASHRHPEHQQYRRHYELRADGVRTAAARVRFQQASRKADRGTTHSKPNEKLQAIDHKEYPLNPETCVIADADHPVAIAGIMGGAETEINATTKDVLIETALFSPLSIRNTSRKLKLRSDSSYRFERGITQSARP